ncbi:hypothetical protein ACFQY0_18995 [Haloferula chungangensis]|uniref:Uncharacterized protein n=1 Tax=Haloferula chungangensis TaxID=1048331 RepID=A0ABW2LA35_9BACT
MAFPIITLLLAALVAFLGFQTGSIDTGMPTESSASVAAPAAEDDGAADDAAEEEVAEEE